MAHFKGKTKKILKESTTIQAYLPPFLHDLAQAANRTGDRTDAVKQVW